MLYLFFKWLHIVAIISWMAGILYLYRLLIYNAEKGQNPEINALLSMMARKLYRIITVPAMSVAYLAGFAMLWLNPAILQSGWFHVKFTAVLALSATTVVAGRLVVRFEKRSENLPTSKRLRILNEVPTLLMLLIVAMVVFRPF